MMAENTVNYEENLNSQSSQQEEEDVQKLEVDSVPVHMHQKTACSSSMAGGEGHVSFVASTQTKSVHQLCELSV